jgi:hypothetical protein
VSSNIVFGFFPKLVMLGGKPPMAWGDDMVRCPLEVAALAEGLLCLTTENAASATSCWPANASSINSDISQWSMFSTEA